MEKLERAPLMDLLTIEQLKSAWAASQPIELGDPVLANTQLLMTRTYYPLGFPVSVSTNCEQVLELARQCWGRFEKRFETAPIRLRVTVTESDAPFCPPTPVCRMRDHIVSNIADAQNYVVTDLGQLTSVIWATDAAVAHGDYFRYFFLESAAMSMISSAHATAIHAACVALDGQGILLCGDSGAGKSTLAYACARQGWSYVTDDGSYLLHDEGGVTVVGNCHQVRFRPSAESLFPELHGRQVMQRAGVGKPSIELSVSRGNTVHTSPTARVRHVVFLQRNVDKEELVPFPRAVARMYLWQRVHCMPYQASRHLCATDSLLKHDCLELRYNSLDWAIERLARLVREGE